MEKIEEFEELRPLLFAISYRILGSVTEAEDAVQETWLRYAATPTQPTSAKSFLSAIVTRISIDVLRSARVRREQYVGPWFPQPLLTDPYQDPSAPPSWPTRCRWQRCSCWSGSPRSSERSSCCVRSSRSGSLKSLPLLDVRRSPVASWRPGRAGTWTMAADVHLVGDGGGKAPQWKRGILGGDNVARVLGVLAPSLVQVGGLVEPHEVNGQPGAIFRDRAGKVLATWVLDISDGQIQTIRSILNPDKLKHVGPVADGWAVFREAMDARRSPQPAEEGTYS